MKFSTKLSVVFFLITSAFVAGAQTAPTTQATNITFSSATTTSITVRWTKGNAAANGGRYVIINTVPITVADNPTDGINYVGSLDYTAAPVVGLGTAKLIYNEANTGTGGVDGIIVTGLTANTTYYFKVFEFNSNGGGNADTNNTSDASGNPASGSTLATQPTQASAITFNTITNNSMSVNFTNGGGTSRILVARAGSAVSFTPADGTGYTANNDFSAATDQGSGNKIVGAGSGPIAITGLSANTTYHFAVFEFNGASATANYNTTTPPTASQATSATEPTTQATNITFSSLGSTSYTVNWTSGDGANRLVLAHAGAAVDANPTDFTSYTANAAFSSGDEIGTGNYVVYSGSGNSVPVTGLSASTVYHFRVYEYNGTGTLANFMTGTATGNPANRTTLAAQPTQASAITFSSVTNNSMSVNFTDGGGTSRILVARAGSAVSFSPVDGTGYSANTDFSAASDLGSGNKIVGAGSGPIVITGLSANTTYHFAVFEFNGATTTANYNTTTPPTASQASGAAEPTTQATNITFSSLGSTSYTVNWTSGDGANRLVLAHAGAAVDANPTDFTSYTANAAFSSGDQIGTGNYVVYSGSGNSVTVTGLSASTVYHFRVYEYNGTGTLANFMTGTATGNPANRTTLAAQPTQASAITFSSVTNNSMSVNFTDGGGTSRILVARAGSAVSFTPADGTGYTANNDFSAATDQGGTGNKVVGAGSGPIVITGLSANTTYHFAVFEFNGATTTANYNTTTPPTASQTSGAAEPTTQATNITFSSLGSTSYTVNWTSGDGANRLVLAHAGAAVDANPTDFTSYTANAAFSSGDEIGTGNYVVYSGSGNSVPVTGLSASTVYHFRVYEYNGTGTLANFMTGTATGNPANRTTLAAQPTQASAITFSSVTNNSMSVNFTDGGGASRILVARAGSAVSFSPVDGTGYSANTDFSAASDLGSGNKIVGAGSGPIVITGLSANTTYHFAVFEFNGASATANYNTTTPPTASQASGADEPTTQATNITFSSLGSTSYTVNWTSGDGANRLVLAHAGAAVDADPADFTNYTANAAFSSGDQIGTGNYIVYSGNGNNVTVTGLSASAVYHFNVYEYNGTGALANFMTGTATGNPASRTTLAAEPTQASAITFSSVTNNSMSVNFTDGGGASRILVARAGSAVSFSPVDGTGYTANNDFSAASDLGSGNKIVGAGSGPIVITGLSANTTYHFAVFEFNGASATANYNTTTPPTASQTSGADEPTTQATNITFSSLGSTSYTVNWTSGDGANRLVLAHAGAAVDADPADFTNYTANAAFLSGDQIGTGNYVVYSGNGNNVTVTGLSASTVYHFSVYEYNGTGALTNFMTGTATGNPASRTTLAAEPTQASTAMTFSSIGANTITIGKTSGAGTGSSRLLIARAGSAVTFSPVDGTSYTANSDFSAAADVGGGDKIVGSGNGATFVVTGLSADQTYHFRIVEFNGTSGSGAENYFGTTLTGNRNTEPAQQTSGLTFTAFGQTSLTLGWDAAVAANGDRRLVVGRATSSVLTEPTDFTSYTASATFGSGTQIGTGNRVVFDGTGTSVAVTGLTANTQYEFAAYEYNGAGTTSAAYLTPAATLVRYTLAGEPSNSATSMVFSLTTSTSVTVGWTAPSGGAAGYVVLRRVGASPTGTLTDGTTYTVGATVGDGTVAYVGSATSFNDTGLSQVTNYYYDVIPYNGAGAGAENYRNTSALTGNTTTPCTAPTLQASNITFGATLASSIVVNWTRGNGDAVLILVRDGGSTTADPTDGTSYSASSTYGNGDVVSSSGNDYYAIYNGTGTTVTLTGLDGSNGYNFKAYEYNTTNTCYNLSEVNASQTTAAASNNSTITGGTGSATISSIANDAASEVDALTFTITDLGDDDISARFTQMVFTVDAVNNDITDLTQLLAGAQLYDDSGNGPSEHDAAIITSNTITIPNINVGGTNAFMTDLGTIVDGNDKVYTLRVWLNTSLGGTLPTTVDGLNLVLSISGSDITVPSGKSGFAANQTQTSGASNNAISVVATQLNVDLEPSTTAIATVALATQPIFTATDVRGNLDLDFNNSLTVGTSNGTIGPNSALASFTSGIADFAGSGFNFSNTGTTTMNVSTTSPNLTSANSNSITVSALTTLGAATAAISTSPLTNNSTGNAVLRFSLQTTGSTLNLTDLTFNSSPAVTGLVKNFSLYAGTVDNFGLASEVATSTSLTFAGMTIPLSTAAKYFYLVCDVEPYFLSATPTIQFSLPVSGFTVSLGDKAGATQTGTNYTLNDLTSPTVTSITNSETLISENNLVQTVTVEFSEPMNSAAIYQPAITISGAQWDAQAASGGTNGWSGDTYTATITHQTGAGNEETVANAVTEILTNVARDWNDNQITNTITSDPFVIDNQKPFVIAISFANSVISTNNAELEITVDYSENMSTTDFPTITFSTNADDNFDTPTPSAANWVSATRYRITYTHDLTEQELYNATASINGAIDANSNVQTASSNATFDIDTKVPGVSSIVRSSPLAEDTNASSVTFEVTFDEPVQGVTADDFDVTASGVTYNATLTVFQQSTTEYLVTIDNISGDGTIRLDVPALPNITDDYSNQLADAFSSGESYLIDQTVPSVSAFAISDDTNGWSTTNGISPAAGEVNFTIEFSELVSGVDINDFEVYTAVFSVEGPAISYGGYSVAQGAGNTWIVTVNGITGYGLIRLAFKDDNTIVDPAGNAIDGLADGSINIGFTSDDYYSIVVPEPSDPVTNFASVSTTNSLTITWDDAVTPASQATHYFVRLKKDAISFPPNPEDGGEDLTDTDFSDGRLAHYIQYENGLTTATTTFTGLSSGTAYDIEIFPVAYWTNYSIDNQDYLLTPLTGTASTTTASNGLIGNVISNGTIPSTAVTAADQVTVLTFDIFDDGGVPNGDDAPFKFSELTVFEGTGDQITDWTEAIEEARLYNGASYVVATGTNIQSDRIIFESIPSASASDVGFVSDAACNFCSAKSYQLRIWLKSTLGGTLPADVDNSDFVFVVNNASFVYNDGDDLLSSQLAATQSANSGNGNNKVAVTASQLVFRTPGASPTATEPQAQIGVASDFPVATAPKVYALDQYNNHDKDYNESISITNDSNLGQQNPTYTAFPATGGVLTISDFHFTEAGTSKIRVKGTGVTSVADAVSTDVTAVISSLTQITSGAGSETATISSLTTALSGAIAPQVDATQNFDFTITDDAGANATTFEDNDGLPTRISQIVITRHTDNDAVLVDWAKIIVGAQIFSGAHSANTGASGVSSNSLIFNIDPSTLGLIADGASKTYGLRLVLRQSVDPSIVDLIDNKDLVLQVVHSSISTLSGNVSSTLQSSNTNSGNNNNKIDVDASHLVFSTQPNGTQQYDAAIAPSPVAKAQDANGNLDIDFAAAVTVQSSNTTLYPVLNETLNVANGIIDFDPNFQITSANNGPSGGLTYLIVSSAGLANGQSDSFTLNYSNESTIVQSYNYPVANENIRFISIDADNIDTDAASRSIILEEFTLNDGGADLTDTDGSATILTDITFAINNWENLKQLALYDGSDHLAELSVPGNIVAGEITFSGLSFTADDNDFNTLSLRASFQDVVDDNEVITFTITAVVAKTTNSSQFNDITPGVTSAVAGDENRIEVVTTELAFTTNPDPTNISSYVNVDNPYPVVSAVDVNGNVDVDYNGTVGTATSSITMQNLPSGNFTNGIYDFAVKAPTFQFTEETLSATLTFPVTTDNVDSDLPTAAVSNPFSVTASVESHLAFVNGSTQVEINYETLQDATLNTTNITNSHGLMGLELVDGLGTSIDPDGDVDGASTVLTGLTVSISNPSFVRTVALYDGNNMIAGTEKAAAALVSWTGLSITALDNNVKQFQIRASFADPVTDNAPINLVVTAVTNGGGSKFAATDGGAAFTPVGHNLIDVDATKLAFTVQPDDVALVSTNLTTPPEVQAWDALDNLDTDYDASIAISNADFNFSQSDNTLLMNDGVLLFPASFQYTDDSAIPAVNGSEAKLTVAHGTLTNGVSESVTLRYAQTTTIAAGTDEPAKISSLRTNAADPVNVFNFKVLDDNGATGDGSPTRISDIVIIPGTDNEITNWTHLIAGAYLTDDLNNPTKFAATDITSNTIAFAGIDIATMGLIDDNEDKEYSLSIYLHTSLGGTLPEDVDNLVISFKITDDNSSITLDGKSSQFTTHEEVETIDTENEIAVVATQLLFEPGTDFEIDSDSLELLVNKDISLQMTAPQVRAFDQNLNFDRDYNSPLTTQNTGGLLMTTAPSAITNGVLIFANNFQFDDTGDGTLTITPVAVNADGVVPAAATSAPIEVRVGRSTTITEGNTGEPNEIPSLTDIIHDVDGLKVFDFSINDDPAGTPDTENDGNPTRISKIRIVKGAEDADLDWTQLFEKVMLDDGTGLPDHDGEGTIYADSLVFGEGTGIPNEPGEAGEVVDNDSKVYSLTIWLKQEIGGATANELPAIIDNKRLEFEVKALHIVTNEDGTSFIQSESENSDPNNTNINNRIVVEADTLRFSKLGPDLQVVTPYPVSPWDTEGSINTPFVPILAVEATDFNNNRDIDFEEGITAFSVNNSLAILNGPATDNSETFTNGIFKLDSAFQYASGNDEDGSLTMTAGGISGTSRPILITSSFESSLAFSFDPDADATIDYIEHTESNAYVLGKFELFDGDADGDDDGANTVLNSFTISLTNPTNIASVELYDYAGLPIAGTEQAVNGQSSIQFTGLSITATDEGDGNIGSETFTLRAIFEDDPAKVHDRDLISMRVTEATLGGGSKFLGDGDSNDPRPTYIGGVDNGSLSPTQHIEVTATSFDFLPPKVKTNGNVIVGIDEVIPPIIVEARDTNNIRDIDYDFEEGVSSTYRTATITTSNGDSLIAPINSGVFQSGVMTITGLQYKTAGNGTLIINKDSVVNSEVKDSGKSNHVDVLHMKLKAATRGVVPAGNDLQGGDNGFNKAIFGVTFYPQNQYTADQEPRLKEFTIEFTNPVSGVYKEFRIFEFAGSKFDASAIGNLTTEDVDIISDLKLKVSFPVGRSITDTLSYFLVVDVEEFVDNQTPRVQAFVSNEEVPGNIIVSTGSVFGRAEGFEYGFASTNPPLLVGSYPATGQTNIHIDQSFVKLIFNRDVYTLDGQIGLFSIGDDGEEDTVILMAQNGRWNANPDLLELTQDTLIFNIPPSTLEADRVYYVRVAAPVAGELVGIRDSVGLFFEGIDYPGTVFFKTTNNLAPKLIATSPLVSDVNLSSALVSGIFDSPGKAYLMVVEDVVSNPAPTNNLQIKDEQDISYPGVRAYSGSFDIINTKTIRQYGLIAGLDSSKTYRVYMYAEGFAERDHELIELPNDGYYTAPSFEPIGGFSIDGVISTVETYSFTTLGQASAPTVVKSNVPNVNLCKNSEQILNVPILITEANPDDFNQGGAEQSFYLLLPTGFQFDISTVDNAPVFGEIMAAGSDFVPDLDSLIFISNSILQVKFVNNASNSYDVIAISGLKIIAGSGAVLGDIQRFGGNAFVSEIPDLSVLATVQTYNVTAPRFSNTYSETQFPDWVTETQLDYVTMIPMDYNDGAIDLIPKPQPEEYQYGVNVFSGTGVNVNELSMGSLASSLNQAFNVTMTHTDQNSCVAQRTASYVVYETSAGINDENNNPFAVEICLIPQENETAEDIVSYEVINSTYGLTRLEAKALSSEDSDDILKDDAGWQALLLNYPVEQGIGGANPRGFKNYTLDRNILLDEVLRLGKLEDASITDARRHPKFRSQETTPGGQYYYTGGSIGKIQFTGYYEYKSSSSIKAPRRHVTEYFVPAIPVVEVYDESSIEAGTNIPIFCQAGEVIRISGYPKVEQGATGVFRLENAEDGVIIIDENDGFTDNTNGTATLNPSLLFNDYKNIRIVYTYFNEANPCGAEASLIIRITPNPEAIISLGHQCAEVEIEFSAASSTIDSEYEITAWEWNFADPTAVGGTNKAITEVATHTYPDAGAYPGVSLQVWSNVGCASAVVTTDLNLGGIPVVNYTLENAGDIITINTADTEYPLDAADSIKITGHGHRIGANKYGFVTFADSVTTGGNQPRISYNKSMLDTLSITIVSQKGCTKTVTGYVASLTQEQPSASNVYNAFEDNSGSNWLPLPIGLEDYDPSPQTNQQFSVSALSWEWDGEQWATTANPLPNERSALYSPIFDFTEEDFARPIITFAMSAEFSSGDGVVLEYSTDAFNILNPAKQWHRLGRTFNSEDGTFEDSGVQWYTDRDLGSSPGDQSDGFWGWTNTTTENVPGNPANGRVQAKHSLAKLVGSPNVMLRFALATGTIGGADFEIDSLRIGNGTRTVLLENFTNSSTAARSMIGVENDTITSFRNSGFGRSIVKINYHTSFPAADPFNLENQSDNGSRALYYNITRVPQARLDGELPDGITTQPFSQWGGSHFDKRILDLAGALITCEVKDSLGSIIISGKVKALQNLPATALLQVAIIEEEVSANDDRIIGRVDAEVDAFTYVLRKMLPSATGTRLSLFNGGEALTEGDSIMFNTGLRTAFIWSNPQLFDPADDLAVILFVQDEITKEVYQASRVILINDPDDEDVVGVEDPEHGFSVYPNPADQSFTIQLPKPVTKRSIVRLYDQVGKVATEATFEKGESEKSVSTSDFAAGVYLLQVETGDGMITQKVMVVHRQ